LASFEITSPEEKQMSQSLSKVLIQIIFSTKDRFPFLADLDSQKRIHGYLARIFKEHDSPAIEVGGTKDHVHILCLLSRNYAISEIVKDAKAYSSSFAKSFGGRCQKFSWQSGYGAFSISQSQTDPLRQYIRGQVEHHRRRTFQEEYLEILNEYRIPYDEKYLWD
jgi:putative transposase